MSGWMIGLICFWIFALFFGLLACLYFGKRIRNRNAMGKPKPYIYFKKVLMQMYKFVVSERQRREELEMSPILISQSIRGRGVDF